MDHFITLGPAPTDEPHAHVGEEGYDRTAQLECGAFINEIREQCGVEPEDALLATRRIDGVYVVVCYYNGNIAARRYAQRVMREQPTQWSDVGRQYLRHMETRAERAARELQVGLGEVREAYGDGGVH